MPRPDASIWRQMLAHLRRYHSDICRQWFEQLELLSLDGGLMQIGVPNPVQENYLRKRCTEQFNDAAQAATGALVAVVFVDPSHASRPSVYDTAGNNGRDAPEGAMTLDPPPTRTGIPLDSDNGFGDDVLLSPDSTFEHFVTGPGNRLAYAASVAVARQPGLAYNPLFIHGGVGLGKTHLLQAVCQQILEANRDARICYLSCDSFVNRFLEAVKNGQMHNFRHRYRHVDLLLIDDIHFLANRERTQEEVFHTFNTLYQANKQIILSSDSSPNEIPQLEERLVSRFNWGLVARIDKPCYETRLAILRKKSQLRQFSMPDDVACYIASKIEANTRELEGAITKLQSLAMLRQVPVTLELAQEALGDEPAAPVMPQLSIQNIIDAVTSFYNVKLADLQSKRRHRSIVGPRQVCMYLARKRTRYSLEEIGGYFGGRDHTTVLHAINTIEQRIGGSAEFGAQIDRIDQMVTGSPPVLAHS